MIQSLILLGTLLALVALPLPLSVTPAPGALAAQTQGTKAPPAKPAPKPEELDKLLAPVALYPDSLLAQMLICAANPGKVATLNDWLASHPDAKGTELQDAATKAGFEPSYVALSLFPQVVGYMASQIAWTTQLGETFAADRSAVFASIQRLRSKAQAAGKLKSTPQQEVETKTTSSGQQVIVIEPANPQVVYVPQYNPQTVYVPSTSSTVVVQKEDDDSGEAVAAGLIGFTAGIAIGAAMDNDYYYGPYGWRGGAYMYNDAWDDWYDNREDAREDWMDHREDLYEERGDVARNAQEERTQRTQSRQENRPETQAQRQQRATEARTSVESARASGMTSEEARSKVDSARASGASQEARGYNREGTQAARERSGTRSDAFSGYSSGKSERSASQRGQKSRSSSRSGGGRRR